jgi:serine protease Do
MSALLAASAATVGVIDDADPLPKRPTVTGRVITGIVRVMFVMAALALTMLGFVLGVPSAHAESQTQIDQQVKQSLVYISVEYEGYVLVPAAQSTSGNAFWSNGIKVDFSCSGVIVDPTGYIVTAGHCVDPNNQGVKQAILTQLFLNSGDDADAAARATQSAINQEWMVEGKQPGSPIDRLVSVIQPEGPGRIIDHFVTAQVVDFQKFDDGDNALIKVANEPSLPALPVADKAPVPGTALTSVGFPGDVGGAMDASRLQEPSFKDGTSSSQQVTPSGAARTEISAAISPGMSGGPTVDDATGEVVGLNDFTLSGENQPFNFITDAAALRAFLLKNSVHLVVPPAPAQPFPWMWIAVGGAVGVVLLALPVVLVVRRRAKRLSVPPIDGSQLLQPAASAQPAPQQPVVEQQSPSGASEPARDQRSDVPVTTLDEQPSTAPPQLTPSTNGAVEIT